MKLNADLGEGEPPARTRALLDLVDLANVACGGHAGTVATMERTVRWARARGVAVGAHPGTPADFGRGPVAITPEALEVLLIHQVGGLQTLVGASLHHVKLHGALYHAVEGDARLARAYARLMADRFPAVAVVALARGRVAAAARAAGVPVLEEVFAERGYRTDGTLIPRGEPGDLITDPAVIVARLPQLRGDTICIHADSPNAVRIARAVRAAVGPRGQP